ncbi:MAG: radical SAM protein [Bacteroidota bacterium]
MLDKYNRRIHYLRISVIDRCNLRCWYCMPKTGVQLLKHEDILSYEEITQVVETAVQLGIDKIRLTGGEPLIRRDILLLVSMIAGVKSIKDLAMTTNGILLEQFAQPLAEAGLKRINISLDTIDPEKYKEITRGGDINNVFTGIEAARTAGLQPIKINCVVLRSSNETDARDLKKYCNENNLKVRFIHQMDLTTGEFSVVEGGEGGDCKHCNRLRLTSNGIIKPCLFSDLEFDIRKLGAEQAIKQAIKAKPESGTCNFINKFHNIGG